MNSTQQIWFSTPGCVYSSGGSPADAVVTIQGVTCLLAVLLKIVPPLLIIAAVAMLIMGGAKLILAGEDPTGYKTAMHTIQVAIIGIIGLGLSWIILRVIQFLVGGNILTIPSF